MIKAHNLNVRRSNAAILRNITFELGEGVIGLVAPNGSGKTTLLESLAKPWDRRVAGKLSLDGNTPTPKLWEKTAFYLPSANEVLEPTLTGRQHAELAKSFWGSSASIEKVAEACGSSPFLDVTVRKCSQGMRQLVAITVAMCTGARLLLLDEPLSALDPTNTDQATQALRKYASSGRTILMSTHNLANVDTSCDSVLYLKGGTIVDVGELKQAGNSCRKIYQALYQDEGNGRRGL